VIDSLGPKGWWPLCAVLHHQMNLMNSNDGYDMMVMAVADPGFARGADHGEHAECEPKRGSGAVGSRGRAPGGDQGGKAPLKLEAESFLYIFIQKCGQKLRIQVKICPRV